MIKFTIKGVGLDTTEINHPFIGESDRYDIIFTSISANNDFLIAGSLKQMQPDPPLVVYVEFLEDLSKLLNFHIKELGREKIDVLLFDASLEMDKIIKATEELDYFVKSYGLMNPKTGKQLEDFLQKKENVISSIGINISPTDFNYDVIRNAKIHNLTIYGFNQFGGYLSSSRNILSFSVPYLLSFSAANCDYVIVSGRDLEKACENMQFLRSLITKEHGDNEYKLEKKIFKPASSLGMAIYTSLDLGHGYKLPYSDPNFCTLEGKDIITSFGKPVIEYPSSYSYFYEFQQVYAKINDILKILTYRDSWPAPVRFAYAKYHVMNFFRTNYPNAEINYVLVGKSIFLISFFQPTEFKGAFLWRTPVKEEAHGVYFLANPRGNEIIWREAEDEDREDEIDVLSK